MYILQGFEHRGKSIIKMYQLNNTRRKLFMAINKGNTDFNLTVSQTGDKSLELKLKWPRTEQFYINKKRSHPFKIMSDFLLLFITS